MQVFDMIITIKNYILIFKNTGCLSTPCTPIGILVNLETLLFNHNISDTIALPSVS